MTFALARNWWSLVIRGILGILVGLITFVWPGITLMALVFLFAGYAFVEGVVSLAGAVHAAHAHERWAALLVEGLLGIAAGTVTILWPGITALGLVFMIAGWAILTGVAEVVAAVRLRRYISGEWLLALAGVASVVFGVLAAAVPLAGALVIVIPTTVMFLIFNRQLRQGMLVSGLK